MAVRCAIMVRLWSSAARSTMAMPAPRQRPDQRGGRRALEHAGEEAPQEDKARDAEGQREQTEQDRKRDAHAVALGHAPQGQVEMHPPVSLALQRILCGGGASCKRVFFNRC